MALKTVTGKVSNAGPAAPISPTVWISLSQPAVITGTQEVLNAPIPATVASDGSYSVQLQANGDLTPSTTYYTVTESVATGTVPQYSTYQFTIVVPQTAGPFVMSNIATPPPALGPAWDADLMHLSGAQIVTGVKVIPVQDKGGMEWNVKAFGAVGDGTSHPLSGYFATLGAAQAVYPAATALTNEIDWAAGMLADSTAAGKGVVIYPAGTYKHNVQSTFTAPIRGAGVRATIFSPTALGTGVPAYIFNPQSSSAIDRHSFPVAEGIQFKGPGARSLGVKTAAVNGIRLDTQVLVRDCSVQQFDSGIIANSALGHITLDNVVSSDNYYGLYAALGQSGDIFIIDGQINGNTWANIAVPGSGIQQLTGMSIYRTHLGFAPFGIYQETGTSGGFMNFCTLIDAKFEAIGNCPIYSEQYNDATKATFGDNFIVNPGHSWDNAYKLGAGSAPNAQQDYAIKAGINAQVNFMYVAGNGGGWITGTAGVMFFKASQAALYLFGEHWNSGSVYDLAGVGGGQQYLNRLGTPATFGDINLPIVSRFNSVATQGLGVPAIYSAATLLSQTAAVASVASLAVPNDNQRKMYRVSVSVVITTLGSGSINAEVTYFSDPGVTRTKIIPLCPSNGVYAAAANTADSWEGSVPISMFGNGTAITVLTVGTFTGCTYHVHALIEQMKTVT